jgi:SOS-response transcriptional repressor LexA
MIFADNRQDAAFQAGWMRDHARRYRLRYLLVEALSELEQGKGPVSVGDLHGDVVRRLRSDRDLARAVAPEAFDGGADEPFGRLSDTLLSRFIRIQILRELATAFAQRDGLERWGQLRVVYAGLEPGRDELATVAAELGLAPQALADGIASLLDVWRRGRLLHDADEPIFGKWWQAGSEEVLRGFIPFGLTEVSPEGVKLEKAGGDADSYVRAVVSSRGRTGAVDFIGKWGVADPKAAAARVWELIRELGLVTPVRLVGGNGRPLSGSSGAHQVDASRIGLVRQNERYVCSVCGRVHARPTPNGACTKTYCAGTVAQAEPPENDYNVSLLSRPFAMVTPEEHTAQVPAERRDEIEKSFKRAGGAVNTLVATPTLELGVDIGALDLVLCRNVPPTAANYWQRVGRAGRRRRMAVVYVYCRQAIHDAYFFERPHELLGAPIRPPRFNLKNDVLVRKHVHAAVLSELLRIARDDEDAQRSLSEAVPQYIGDYLFEGPDNRYRTAPADVSALASLIDTHRALVVDAVQRVFAAGWPSEAADEVAPELLERLVLEMPGELQGRAKLLHDRLTWVVDTQNELAEIAGVRPLTGEEQRQRDKADSFIQAVRERHVRTYTLSVLAGEGFLPGYGLYNGGISAFPGWRGGAIAFELSRPPSIAVREFVPGNLLYANRGRYRVSRYHFPIRGQAQRTESYDVEPQTGLVRLSGTAASGYASGPVIAVEGLPIADVDLALVSRIGDEENDRFQVPVTILGLALRHRRHGVAYRFGDRDVHHVLGQGLRLVNAGPADRVRAQELGYPVCVVCGACRSPYASARELADFAEWHSGHCGLRPRQIALTANVVADALHFQGLDDQADAANLGEAIRLGAAQVLSMEPDDLQTLPMPTGDGRYDLFIYDPMPGGSGLLGQIVDRWLEIVAVLETLLTDCAGGCETSCYSCLRTGRNVFWHRFLDRHRALELLASMSDEPVEGHTLSPQEDASLVMSAATTSAIEDRLEELLNRAGLEGFVGQHEIQIGSPYERTIPDFAYVGEKVAVYLDGLSKDIHGNEARQRADAIMRSQLEDLDWKVVAIAASHLDDPEILGLDFRRIARALGRSGVADNVSADTAWYEERSAANGGAPAIALVDRADVQPYMRHVPLYSIRAAAGRFLENEEPSEEGWVEASGTLHDGMFAIRVKGRSMEPTIPDGAIALFVADPSGGPLPGSREGKIVLAQLHEATDPEDGGSYTVKRYHSEKAADESGSWRHIRVVLQSLNREVTDIELSPDQDVDVIAEYLGLLGVDRNIP